MYYLFFYASTDILNITAAPNNGTKGSLNHILKETRYLSNEEQQNDDYHSSTLRYKDAGEFVSFVQSNPCGGDCKHFSETEVRSVLSICICKIKITKKIMYSHQFAH
jgi:hypothetical protein